MLLENIQCWGGGGCYTIYRVENIYIFFCARNFTNGSGREMAKCSTGYVQRQEEGEGFNVQVTYSKRMKLKR